MQRVPLGGGDIVDIVRLFDDWRWLNNLLAEDVALDEIRQPDLHLIAEELLRRDREDLVDFLKSLCMLANTHTKQIIDIHGQEVLTSCFVSRTKAKIMNQAIRLRPA